MEDGFLGCDALGFLNLCYLPTPANTRQRYRSCRETVIGHLRPYTYCVVHNISPCQRLCRSIYHLRFCSRYITAFTKHGYGTDFINSRLETQTREDLSLASGTHRRRTIDNRPILTSTHLPSSTYVNQSSRWGQHLLLLRGPCQI